MIGNKFVISKLFSISKFIKFVYNFNIEDISFNEDDEAVEQFIQPNFSGHNENLAEKLPEGVLSKISSRLIDDIENDIISRKDWEDGLSDILKQLGIKVLCKCCP